MKKIISVLLCICLMMSAMCISSFGAERKLKITVTTDTHYQSAFDNGELSAQKNNEYTNGMLNSDLYYYATVQGQMNFESKAIISEFLNEFIASDSEYLLIAGDLTCGKRTSHLEFARMLKDAEEKSGKEIFVINGNHDCVKESTEDKIDVNEFKEIYADFGYNQASSLEETSASYTAELGDGYRLLAVDSCIYGEDDGQITGSVYSFIAEQVAKAETDGKQLVTMMHHSILPHYYLQPMLDDYMKYAESFADMGLKCVFTGHIHANDISMSKTKSGKILYDVQTGSLIAYPNAYREVTLSDKINIESKYITKIDTALLQDGYTDEQLSVLTDDFSTYSEQFFEAGVCRWMNRYIGSAWKVGRLLKVKEGSTAYAVLDKIMNQVGDALTLPLYDNGTPEIDSYEEILAQSGKKMPETRYTKLYQPASKIMSGFFHGDENSTSEVDLLVKCLECAIKQAVVNLSVPKSSLIDIAEKVCNVDIPQTAIKTLSRVSIADTIAQTVANALVASLADGFVTDYSEPSDINVTLDFESGTFTKKAELTMFEKILTFFKSLFEKLFTFVPRPY